MKNTVKRKSPNCWVCNDYGIVSYYKFFRKIEYEFAYRCNCILGQNFSGRIMEVPDNLAEELAEKNFNNLKELYTEMKMELV